jgi:hypothetical protein
MSEVPTIGPRNNQPCVATTTSVTMEGFDVVEGLTDEVFAWLERQGVAPSGPPFVRIVTGDMTAELDRDPVTALRASRSRTRSLTNQLHRSRTDLASAQTRRRYIPVCCSARRKEFAQSYTSRR